MVGVTMVVMGVCLVCPNLDAVRQNLVGITLCRLLHCFLRPCCYTSGRKGKFVHAYILLLAIVVIESISAMSCTLIGANLTLVHCSVGMKLVVTTTCGCNRRSNHMVRGIHFPPLIFQLIRLQ